MAEMPNDALLQRLAAFIREKRQKRLQPAQVEALTIRLIDAMACGALARAEHASQTLMASFVSQHGTASLIGGGVASPDDAAFCNSYLIRKLDWNDTYIGKNGGHPSDFIGAVLAAAEGAGKSGYDCLQAIDIGTHVMLDLCDAASAISRGWDPSTYVGLAASVAIGCVNGLTETEIVNAVAMTAVSRNMLLARTGRVSSWKALASASAMRDCMFHVAMAQRGLAGPDPAFSGEFGFERLISGPLPLELDAARDRTGDSQLKFFPAIYHAQGPLEACIALHRDMQAAGPVRGPEIEDLSVDIYEFAIRFTADTPAKWEPENLETADHSLPFLAAHAILRGEFGPGSLHATLHDPEVRALAARVRVSADPAFSARFPQATPSCITLKAGGRTYQKHIEHIIGHPLRPMKLDDVRKKFLACAEELKGKALAHTWFEHLEQASQAPLMTTLVCGPV